MAGFVAKEKEADRLRTKEAVEKVRSNKPIHPDFLAAEIVDFLDKDATAILDGFSMSGFFTDKFKSTFAGGLRWRYMERRRAQRGHGDRCSTGQAWQTGCRSSRRWRRGN